MKKIVMLLVLLASYTNSVTAQRNVMLIIADDLGADYCGFYEYYGDTVDMPNIRRLLNKGVRFQNAQSNPVCSATRATILTGRYSFRTGVGYIVGNPMGSGQLDTAEYTLPRALKAFNPSIKTGNIGKWHLHQPAPSSQLTYPNLLGYDWFQGPFVGALTSYFYWTSYLNGVQYTDSTYATTATVNNAINFIQSQGNNPFFLWLAFNAPHTPFHLPPSNLHSYQGLSGTTADITANPKPYFMASLQALDTEIGRLLDTLQQMNKLDSTDIIFIGDNGNTLKVAQNLIPTNSKGTIYQGGVRVPFIISGPSVVSPGRSTSELVNTADIFATVQELFGNNSWSSQQPANFVCDSKSMMPVVLNNGTTVRQWSFVEQFRILADTSDGKAIRNDTYKLLRFDNGKEEFYNLILDREETNNLLLGTLSPTETSNYQYLCNEMQQLLGQSMCMVGLNESVEMETDKVFPNPFVNHLEVFHHTAYTGQYCLTNTLGEIVFQGADIELQRFDELMPGLYFLSFNNRVVKVVKAEQ